MSIVWLASYPRSGNTWLRVFFSNLWAADDASGAADINQLKVSSHAADRYTFDEALAIESSDMSPDEADRLRPYVYRAMAGQGSLPLIVKVHDAYGFTSSGEPLFPADVSAGAIYVVRNPLDVAVSLVHFWNRPADDVIDAMADQDRALAGGRGLSRQLRQRLFSWSRHVFSWMDLPRFPVHVVQFEAMCARPCRTFASVARFAAQAGIPIGQDRTSDPQRIEPAVEYSSFAELSRQERESGFREKPPRVGSFFRSGTVGSWRTALSSTQVSRVLDHHWDAMRRLGYLSAEGEVVDWVEPTFGGDGGTW